jgi:hypothetical protein
MHCTSAETLYNLYVVLCARERKEDERGEEISKVCVECEDML